MLLVLEHPEWAIQSSFTTPFGKVTGFANPAVGWSLHDHDPMVLPERCPSFAGARKLAVPGGDRSYNPPHCFCSCYRTRNEIAAGTLLARLYTSEMT
jgi:hypothetical protein